ncbi:MAG: hydantoinase/oxoprolinase family protein, partial [bacterium]|nr:hydantoinase/oxoprolinase family protein [bacterium]
FTIVNANMVNGIRRVSVERGDDPRDFVLVGAGGATGAHITALASEMGIRRILIPKLASGLCAFGQIISDVKYNYMAPFPERLDGADVAGRLSRTFADLEKQGLADLKGDGFDRNRIDIRRSLDMRYVGQVHECTVEIDDLEISEATLPRIRGAFHDRHKALYTYSEPNTAVEVVNIESAMYGRIEKPEPARLAAAGDPGEAIKGHRAVVFSAEGERIETPVYDGGALGAGSRIIGPAIVEEETTTIVVDGDWDASLHDTGVYVLTPKD